jgi:anti-sigma factor RsiW
MLCNQIEPLLSAYHDGELGKSESESVRQHLLDCQDCRNELSEFRNITKWLAPEGEIPAMGAGFTDRVIDRIRVETGGEAPRVLAQRAVIRFVTIAAAVVFGVSLLYLAAPQSNGTLDAASERDVEARMQAMRDLRMSEARMPPSGWSSRPAPSPLK